MAIRSTVWLIGITALVTGCKTPHQVRGPEYAPNSNAVQQAKPAPKQAAADANIEFSHFEATHAVTANPAKSPVTSNSVSQTQLIVHKEEIAVPHHHADPTSPPLTTTIEAGTLTIEELESLALSNNPTLVQANTQLRAEQGAAYQAGLPFNPVVGYVSEQIGVNDTAGELQGGYVQQEFVTGGKLRLSRAKYVQRAQIAATNAYAQQQRVLNDLRAQFYRTMAAQRVIETHRELVVNGEDNVQTQREMLNLGQVSPSAVLQAEVELRRDQLNLKDAENELQKAWRLLSSLTGVARLAPMNLAGSLVTSEQPLDYDTALAGLLASSPEMTAAWQKIQHDRIAVERERVQPIPNVIAQVTVGRNFESDDTTAGVNVGLPLPVFDRNRGTIQQALADLTRAQAEVRRLELELQTRLATEYRKYLSAWQRVQEYQTAILPKAQEAAELLNQSYEQRRAPWADVLAARRLQRTLNLDYVNSQQMYRESDIAIRGMLLTGGLTEPAAAISGGHIDATPKPR